MDVVAISGIDPVEHVDLLACFPDPTDPRLDLLVSSLHPGAGAARALADLNRDAGAVVLYPNHGLADRLAFVHLDDAETSDTAEALRKAAARVARVAAERKARTVGLVLPLTSMDPARAVAAVVEGFRLAGYRFLQHKSSVSDFVAPERLVLLTGEASPAEVGRGIETGSILADAAAFARDLVNWSPGEKTAVSLAERAAERIRVAGGEATIWHRIEIEAEGMGGLLAVNRGSVEPPTFTQLRWHGAVPAGEPPIVLVGKGIVFDTGGLSLKPTKDSMDHMKVDMAGASAVIGAIDAIARLQLPCHVIGLLPATDNRPGENAYVPGEVVRMHSGLTVEVLNTDAEGRMILADALSFARRFAPRLVIDIATLTGAQVVALGSLAAAFFTNERGDAVERRELFETVGMETGERVSALPMYPEYAELLKSDVADIKNVGGREASAITAAKFLERFTDYPWVHLDIAGPAFVERAAGYQPKGGTGFGVRLLVEVIRQLTST